MKDRMIFFDIDGTLVDSQNHHIPPSAIKTIRQLKQSGYSLGLATGRNFDSVLQDNIAQITDWDAFICNNGQQIYQSDYQLIYRNTMSVDIVKTITHIAEAEGINLLYGSNPSFLRLPANQYVIEAHDFFQYPIPTLVKTYQDEEVAMILAYAPKEYTFQLFKDIPNVSVYPNESTYADIMVSDNSKHKGILRILAHLNRAETEYIAFGDSLNDMEMIENATIGIAMGNANILLKEKADIITRPVMEDGIYYACKYLRLI